MDAPHLHIGGQVIRTTLEHPFYVQGKGWLPAAKLVPGDLLSSDDGRWVAVEEVYDSGEFDVVFNLRVADWHTYFVGGEGWGFSVWAHNAYQVSYGWARRRWLQDQKKISETAARMAEMGYTRQAIGEWTRIATDRARYRYQGRTPGGLRPWLPPWHPDYPQ